MKRLPTFAILCALALTLSAQTTSAQTGVMESAETINPGNVKLAGYAVRNTDADETGVVARAGLGLAEGLDVEGRVGFYDGLTYFGGDLELWLVRDRSNVDFSVGGGLHRSDFDGGPDIFGIDAFAILSGHIGDSVELYGSLDLDFERPDDFDSYTLSRAVAGLEVALSESVDLHFEGGAGLNDRTSDYLGGGIAFYIR